MSELWCSVCGEFRLNPLHHQCPPIWHVHLLDYDEEGEAKEVRARTAKEAAQKRAEQYDNRAGDYPIAQNSGVDAVVWDKDRANPLRFEVEARSEPVYYAKPSRKPIPDGVLRLDDTP